MIDLFLNPGITTKEEAEEHLEKWGCPFGGDCPDISCDICLQKFFDNNDNETRNV